MEKLMRTFFIAAATIVVATGCSSTKTAVNPSLGEYGLTVASVNPTGGVAIGVSPADANGAGTPGSQTPVTGLQLIYKAGTTVTLTAPASTSGPFVSWTGCDSVSGTACTVDMTGQKSVQVAYTGVSSVTIVPATLTATAGAGVQIPAIVNGYGMCTYTIPGSNPPQQQTTACQGSPLNWAAVTPYLAPGATGTGVGTVSSTGYYTPASTDPASAVEVQVASLVSPNVMATVTINNQ